MRQIAIPSLVLAAMVMGVETTRTNPSQATSLTEIQQNDSHTNQPLASAATKDANLPSTSNHLMAQLFYPPASEQQALRVIGKGRARGAADNAQIQLNFSTNEDTNIPSEGGVLFQAEIAQATITKETLQPIVDALVAIGVPADTIEVKITEPQPSVLPFPFPSTGTEGSAGIVVKVEKPTRDRIEQIVKVANDTASKNKDLAVDSVDVQYSVKDCQALEKTAYQAAVNDALNRARAIAEALDAEISIPSVAEPFYEVFIPGCNSDGSLPFRSSPSTYDPDAPLEVVVTKDIFFSFPVGAER
ncbi:MAG TPA: SIMPL domain-containing protein [Coleofasciculaceae cyanobacterium]